MTAYNKLSYGEDAQEVVTSPAIEAPLGYTQITNTSAATGLGTIPAGARYARIDCEVQNVRWRDDGTDPTTSVGMVVVAGSMILYSGDLTAIKFIAVTAGAVLDVSFYG